MAAGQYAALRVDQRGVDVVVVLSAPDGRALRRVDGLTEDQGPEPLPFIAEEAGDYRVEVVRSPGAAAGGSYAIVLEALRPPTPGDRTLAAAEAIFAEGEELRREGGRQALEGAVERHRRALELLRSVGASGREADVLLSQGLAFSTLGDYAQARGAYGRALDLFRAAGRSRESLPALSGLGRAHRILGQPEEALRCYREALALSRKLGARRQEVELLGNLGRAHDFQGRVEEALGFYDQALAGWRELAVVQEQATTLNQLGRLYLQLGEVDQAIDRFEEARGVLEGLEGAGEARTMGRVLASLGAAYRARGESGKGIEYLQEALRLHRQTGDRRDEAVVLGELGLAHRQAGALDAARRHYREALGIHRELGNHGDEATTLLNLGRVHDALGDPAAAVELYDRALPWFAAAGDRQDEAATLFALAEARRHLGDLDAARTAIEAALERIESLREEPAAAELRASYFASKQQYFALYVDLLMELHRREPTAGHDGSAFEASERLRSRSLLEELAETGERRGQGRLAEEEADLARRLHTLELRRMELAPADTRSRETVERELRRVLARHRRVRAALRGGNASRPALSQAGPRRLSEIQRLVLDGETLLLEYYLGEERSFLWAVTSTSLESFVLPGRATLETAARRAYELLPESHRRTAGMGTEIALQELSRLLLAPVGDRLAGRRLLVVADGVLHYIPFAALPLPEKPLQPLVAEHEIVTLPSASTAAVLRERRSSRRQAPAGVAVLADPVFIARGGGFPRLPFSRREAEGILALVPAGQRLELLGAAASREAALSGSLARYRYVHFATHGLLDTAHPELSGLVLSLVDRQGRPENGFLRAHEIADLQLAADLVVLSACRTALGKEIRGEGLVGLTRAFLDAGAEGVLVSLWQVEDRATADLMRRFYKGMLQEGLPPPAALRRAQVSLWQDRRWQAPSYWAGFALQGEWR